MHPNLNLSRDIDKLNERLLKLWPEENSNGHGNDEDIKNAVMDAAERWWYQECKEQWMFHESSNYMRNVNAYDGQGCTGKGCISECPYYPDEGRLSISPGFYEKFISEPYLYPTFLKFLGYHLVYRVGRNHTTRQIVRVGESKVPFHFISSLFGGITY